MYKDLENGFDGFMKNFKDTPAENVINDLEELGVTFVPIGDAKSNDEEERSDINSQTKETDIL